MTDQLPKIQCAATLGRDAEKRTSKQGKDFAMLSLAVDAYRRQPNSDERPPAWWVKGFVFGPDAKDAAKLRKGDRIGLIGRLTASEYDDRKTGEKRQGWSIAINAFIPVKRAKRQAAAQEQRGGGSTADADRALAQERAAQQRQRELDAQADADAQDRRNADAAHRSAGNDFYDEDVPF